jgi:hypothetical protein
MKAFLKSFLSTVTVGVFLCATCVCIQLSHADDPGVGVNRCDIGCKNSKPKQNSWGSWYCSTVIGNSCDNQLPGCETVSCTPTNSNQECACL